LIGEQDLMPVFIAGILIAKALQLTTALLVNSMAPSFLGKRNAGPIVAVIALGGGLGQFVGPQVLGLLRDRTQHYTAGWLFIAASGLAATLITIGFKVHFATGPIKEGIDDVV
jgi:nitrate/nitrite transporter NarK